MTLKSLWHWVFHHLPQMLFSHYACLSCLYPLSFHLRLSVSPFQGTHLNLQTLEQQMTHYSILTDFVHGVTVYYVCTRVHMSVHVHEIENVMDLELSWLPTTPVILLSLAPIDMSFLYGFCIWTQTLNLCSNLSSPLRHSPRPMLLIFPLGLDSILSISL